MDTPPTWFIASSDTPEQSRKIVIENIKQLANSQDIQEIDLKIEEFIKIAGFLNRSIFESLFPKPLCQTFVEYLQRKDERIQQIAKLSLADLIQGYEPKYETIQHLYDLSVFSTENVFYNLVQEVTLYLFSQPMPIQDSKRLGFYSVPLFQKALHVRHEKLMKTIQFLFEMTLNKEMLEKTISPMVEIFDFANIKETIGCLFQGISSKQNLFRKSLSLEQEQFLFKYAALKGDSLLMSYGHFLILWAKKSSYGKPLLDLIHTCFCFDKFLVEDTQCFKANSKTSLQSSLIQSTLNIFFQSIGKAIPTGEWKEPLRQLFFESEEIRLDAMNYIEEFKKKSQSIDVPFPFKELLSMLNVDFPDKTSMIYNFLHSSLHFFCPYSLFVSFSKEDAHALFKRFYWMKPEDRLFLDEYLINSQPISDLITTGFPFSPLKDLLRQEMIKFLGEEKMDEIHLVLKELPSFTDDLNGALLPKYIEFFQAAVKAKEAIEKAIKESKPTERKIIKELELYQEKLDMQLLDVKIGDEEENEQKWNLLKTKVFNICMKDFSLSEAVCLLKKINKKALTIKTKEQIIQACTDPEFLWQLQEFLKKFEAAIENDQSAYQHWIDQKKGYANKSLNKNIENLLHKMISQFSNLNQESGAAISYFHKIRDILLASMMHHQQVIKLIEDLVIPVSLTTRQQLIESLKSSDICKSFEGFLSSFDSELPVTETDILFFAGLQNTDVVRDLFRLDAWNIPDAILDQIIEKIENQEVNLLLTEEDNKIFATLECDKQYVNKVVTYDRLPKTFNSRIEKLKKLTEFNQYFSDLERFKITMDGIIVILNCIKQNIELMLNESNIEDRILSEQLLIYNLKKFRADRILQTQFKKSYEQNPYSLTKEQAEVFNPSYIIEIDQIVTLYTLKIDGSDLFSHFYISLANTLHQTFQKESGIVDIIQNQPLPSLKQLKSALKLIQSNMKFLLCSSFTLTERLAVAELLRIIMVGEAKAKTLVALTSEFAFTWEEATRYTIHEEIAPLKNMDILNPS